VLGEVSATENVMVEAAHDGVRAADWEVLYWLVSMIKQIQGQRV
jgi:hypothetical protein